jgi:hypothetical protein
MLRPTALFLSSRTAGVLAWECPCSDVSAPWSTASISDSSSSDWPPLMSLTLALDEMRSAMTRSASACLGLPSAVTYLEPIPAPSPVSAPSCASNLCSSAIARVKVWGSGMPRRM